MTDVVKVLPDRVVELAPPGGLRGELDRHVGALPRVRRHTLRRLLLADVFGLAFAALLGPLALSTLAGEPADASEVYRFDVAMIPLFVAVFALYGLYRGVTRRISTSVFSDLRNIVNALILSGFLYAVVAYVADNSLHYQSVSGARIVSMCVMAMVTVPLARVIAFGVIGRDSLGTVPVIVVGTGKLAQTVASHLRAHSSVQFVGFVDDNPLGRSDVLGQLDQLPSPLPGVPGGTRRGVLLQDPPRADHRDVEGSERHRWGCPSCRATTSSSRPAPTWRICPVCPCSTSPRPRSAPGARFLKRTFDIVVSSLVLLAASPVLGVIAVMIKATTPGPVFFRQIRTGRNEQPFAVLKFRTMYRDAEARRHEVEHLNEMDGPLFKVADDPRVTRVGRLLRKASLDEIPQLINVWKGDMSLVGPRPFVVSEAMEIEGWARKRFEARPGMTGLWQVSGRNELSHLELCRLDYLYVASWSFWWDMQILWQTPVTVFRGRGAS